MNIALMRLRPMIKELQGIRQELQRMNDIREAELAYNGVHIRPPVADTSGPDPEISYVNEEDDAIREMQELMGRIAKPEV